MLFFELLQVSVGSKEKLSVTPSTEEWDNLFKEAQRQSVVGIAFKGVQRLPQEQWPPQMLLLQWIGYN